MMLAKQSYLQECQLHVNVCHLDIQLTSGSEIELNISVVGRYHSEAGDSLFIEWA